MASMTNPNASSPLPVGPSSPPVFAPLGGKVRAFHPAAHRDDDIHLRQFGNQLRVLRQPHIDAIALVDQAHRIRIDPVPQLRSRYRFFRVMLYCFIPPERL